MWRTEDRGPLETTLETVYSIPGQIVGGGVLGFLTGFTIDEGFNLLGRLLVHNAHVLPPAVDIASLSAAIGAIAFGARVIKDEIL